MLKPSKFIYQNYLVDIALETGFPGDAGKSETSFRIIAAVEQALDKLDPAERELICRYYFDGQSGKRVAEAVGKRLALFEAMRLRVLKKLKKHLAAFVKAEFNIDVSLSKNCVLCDSPRRDEIDLLIASKKPDETWKRIIRILKEDFNIRITAPQILIGHQKYH